MDDPFGKLSNISDTARGKLAEFGKLLRDANSKVNLLSRKDMDDVEYRHIAFCAAIGEFLKPNTGAKIVDVGTGGGLPGIVMAILWPEAKVDMFDGVGKKISMIDGFIRDLGLKNARAFHARIEESRESFDYAVGRSVCALPMFFGFVRRGLKCGKRGSLTNGVIYFKGGELEPELASRGIVPDSELDLEKFFGDSRFEGKKLLHFDASKVFKL